MGLRRADNQLTVFVSNTAIPAAGGTAPAAGEAAFESVNGQTTKYHATLAAALTDSPVNMARVVFHATDGNIYTRTVKGSELVFEKAIAFKAQVNQVDTLSITGSAAAGDEYRIRLAVPNYGGLISQQDEVYFYGSYTAVGGENNTVVATGLKNSLKKACDAAPTAFATVTSAAAVITVTGVAQPYVRAKWDGNPVYFHLTQTATEELMKDRTSTSPANPGQGNYNQVASMEEFFAGYNTDYVDRDANFPGNGSPTLAATPGTNYKAINIKVAKKSDHVNADVQPQDIVVYYV